MLKIGTDHGVDAQVLTWLNDLRTERAGRQGKGVLHESDFPLSRPQESRHCCLGLVDARINYTEETADDICTSCGIYLDLDDNNKVGISFGEAEVLAALNDHNTRPVSFSEIANIIEQAWRCGESITMDFAYMVIGYNRL